MFIVSVFSAFTAKPGVNQGEAYLFFNSAQGIFIRFPQ